jgi:hypothetical protein
MRYLTALTVLFIPTSVITTSADQIKYKDGKVINAVVLEESAEHVIVNLYGQKVNIPRSLIESMEKMPEAENKKLVESWNELDRQFKRESEETEARQKKIRSKTQNNRPRSQSVGEEGIISKPTRSTKKQRPSSSAETPTKKPIEERDIPHREPAETSEHHKALKFKAEIKKAIHQEKVIPGMTKKEVRSAWGWPERTHPVSGIDISTDRWTYRKGGSGLVDVYFENGEVVKVIK